MLNLLLNFGQKGEKYMRNFFKHILYCSMLFITNHQFCMNASGDLRQEDLDSLTEVFTHLYSYCRSSDENNKEHTSILQDFLMGKVDTSSLSKESIKFLFKEHRIGHMLLYTCIFKENESLAHTVIEKILSIDQKLVDKIKCQMSYSSILHLGGTPTLFNYYVQYPHFSRSLPDDTKDQYLENTKKLIKISLQELKNRK